MCYVNLRLDGQRELKNGETENTDNRTA